MADLKRVLQHRCGYELPDDDAGREYLTELLVLNNDKNFRNVIELWAPWLDASQAESIIAYVTQLPPAERLPSPEALGQRLRLTNAERELLGIRQIAPCDRTREQLEAQQKAKRRATQRERRRAQGAVPRDQYRENAERLRAEAAALGETYDALRKRKYREAKRVPSVKPKQKRSVPSVKPINSYYEPHTCDRAAGFPGECVVNLEQCPMSDDDMDDTVRDKACEHGPGTGSASSAALCCFLEATGL